MLQRPADAPGLEGWVAAVESGLLTLDQVRSALILSPEARDFVLPVVRLYQVAFGRVPDAAGLDAWSDALRNGTSLADIARAFAGSAEAARSYGAGDAITVAFVTSMYGNLLERLPESAEIVQLWIASGLSRGEMMLAFINSEEARSYSTRAAATLLDQAGRGVEEYSGSLYDRDGLETMLTVGTDRLTGTSGADVFDAPLAQNPAGDLYLTLQSSDLVDGGAGRDTLKWTIDGEAAGVSNGGSVVPVLKNIEKLALSGTFAGQGSSAELRLDLWRSSGVEEVRLLDSKFVYLAVDHADSATTLTIERSVNGWLEVNDALSVRTALIADSEYGYLDIYGNQNLTTALVVDSPRSELYVYSDAGLLSGLSSVEITNSHYGSIGLYAYAAGDSYDGYGDAEVSGDSWTILIQDSHATYLDLYATGEYVRDADELGSARITGLNGISILDAPDFHVDIEASVESYEGDAGDAVIEGVGDIVVSNSAAPDVREDLYNPYFHMYAYAASYDGTVGDARISGFGSFLVESSASTIFDIRAYTRGSTAGDASITGLTSLVLTDSAAANVSFNTYSTGGYDSPVGSASLQGAASVVMAQSEQSAVSFEATTFGDGGDATVDGLFSLGVIASEGASFTVLAGTAANIAGTVADAVVTGPATISVVASDSFDIGLSATSANSNGSLLAGSGNVEVQGLGALNVLASDDFEVSISATTNGNGSGAAGVSGLATIRVENSEDGSIAVAANSIGEDGVSGSATVSGLGSIALDNADDLTLSIRATSLTDGGAAGVAVVDGLTSLIITGTEGANVSIAAESSVQASGGTVGTASVQGPAVLQVLQSAGTAVAVTASLVNGSNLDTAASVLGLGTIEIVGSAGASVTVAAYIAEGYGAVTGLESVTVTDSANATVGIYGLSSPTLAVDVTNSSGVQLGLDTSVTGVSLDTLGLTLVAGSTATSLSPDVLTFTAGPGASLGSFNIATAGDYLIQDANYIIAEAINITGTDSLVLAGPTGLFGVVTFDTTGFSGTVTATIASIDLTTIDGGAGVENIAFNESTTNAVTVTGGGGNDTFVVVGSINPAQQVFRYAAATDAQLGGPSGITVGNATSVESITGFDTGADLIDVSGFGFSGGSADAFDKVAAVTSSTDLTSIVDFFDDAGADKRVAFAGVGSDTYLFIDADEDGDFSVIADSVVLLIGVTTTGLGAFAASDVVFA